MKLIRNIFILYTLCFSSVSKAENILVLTEHSPPYQYLDSQKNPTGYAVELMRAVLKEAKLPQKITMTPWAHAYNQALKKKNVILFTIARSEEREDKFKWIGEVEKNNYVFYSMANRQDIKVGNIADLKKQRVGVIRSSFEHSALKKLGFSKLVLHSNYQKLVEMANAGRLDLLFHAKIALDGFINDSRFDASDFKLAYELKELEQRTYISLSLASNQALEDRLKKAYTKIVELGEKDRLKKLWFPELMTQDN